MNVTKRALLMLLMAVLAVSFAFGGAQGEDEEPMMDSGGAAAGEIPFLADRVASGDLPPMAERLPDNPKVVEMIEGIGNYGGDLTVFATGANIFNQDLQGMWGTSWLRNPRSGVGVEPDIAEDYEISADNTTLTIYLREGMKWSDGAPFTSEDTRFALQDLAWKDLPYWNRLGTGSANDVVVVDDYTVQIINKSGLGTRLLEVSTWFGGYAVAFQPAHYLKKWHADYNDDAQAIAEEEGYDTWEGAIRDHYWWAPLQDTDKPQVEPWELTSYSDTLKVSERNPYFHRTDPEGNQLPYVDRLIVQVVDPEVYQLKVTGGEASIAYYNLTLENLQLYKSNEQSGDYRVVLHPGVAGSEVKLFLNFNHSVPAMAEILNDIRFRQAISVSIDREEVQQVIYQGQGRAGQIAPLESSSFYQEGWRDFYAQYDPAMANRLLDEMGLTARDSQGFRLRKDGQPLSLVIMLSSTAARYSAELEMITEYMREVGLKTTFNLMDGSAIEEITQTSAETGVQEWFSWVHPEPIQPKANERAAFQTSWVWTTGGWTFDDLWQQQKEQAARAYYGEQAWPDTWMREDFGNEDQFVSAPMTPWREWFIEMHEIETRWQATEMGSAEYRELAREFFNHILPELPMIGVVGEVPNPMIVKGGLRNAIAPGWVAGQPVDHEYVQTWMDQLYWE